MILQYDEIAWQNLDCIGEKTQAATRNKMCIYFHINWFYIELFCLINQKHAGYNDNPKNLYNRTRWLNW